jgi:hypothetical protein
VVEDFGWTPVVHKGLLREIFDLKLGSSDRPDLDGNLGSCIRVRVDAVCFDHDHFNGSGSFVTSLTYT